MSEIEKFILAIIMSVGAILFSFFLNTVRYTIAESRNEVVVKK